MQGPKFPEEDDSRELGRSDFTYEILSVDEAARKVTLRLIPDPRRYTVAVINGEKHYVDKYLQLAVSEKEMLGMGAGQIKELPIWALSAHIDSTPKYAADRKIALGEEMKGGTYIPPIEKPMPHRPLEGGTSTKRLVFLSVDICGSTVLRNESQGAFDRAYDLFLRELGTVVGQFNGTILKTTGDGFIAFIDYPAFTLQCDHAIDMGLSLIVVLRDSINPALHEAGLPILKIRVGADFGDAEVRHIKVPLTGFMTHEIASNALNRAVKIQESAAENEFRIGRRLYELVHVQWLERATEVPFDHSKVGIPGYKIFRIS